jgi:hypothetical protein
VELTAVRHHARRGTANPTAPQAKHTLGKHGKSPRGTPAAMDPDVLLRILCHRADHAASKYLKKEHKIPKKIPGSLSTSVSDITHKATGGLLRRGKTA